MNFEEAFIQCLKDGVYPGPSNINERWRKDGKRLNRLNGQYSRQRRYLMYMFGVGYQRPVFIWTGGQKHVGDIPDWPFINYELFRGTLAYEPPPEVGTRKHEIQDPDKPWDLRRK